MPSREALVPHAKLQGVDLSGWDLAEIDLSSADLSGANLSHARLDRAKLVGTVFNEANLSDACLVDADLSGAMLRQAKLYRTKPDESLKAINHKTGVILVVGGSMAANLTRANLRGADLTDAYLNDAVLDYADLRGARLDGTDLNGVSARFAIVDGETLLPAGSLDRDTDFTGVGLDSARIAPWIATSLKDNRRRIHWLSWCARRNKIISYAVRGFWHLSDYGSSTMRIVTYFIALTLAFAVAYMISTPAAPDVPSFLTLKIEPMVQNLHKIDGQSISGIQLVIRSVYFSVVTMTTLGFGDMYANPLSPLGHIVIATQVVLGYVLLGALVTRLGILFQQ